MLQENLPSEQEKESTQEVSLPDLPPTKPSQPLDAQSLGAIVKIFELFTKVLHELGIASALCLIIGLPIIVVSMFFPGSIKESVATLLKFENDKFFYLLCILLGYAFLTSLMKFIILWRSTRSNK